MKSLQRALIALSLAASTSLAVAAGPVAVSASSNTGTTLNGTVGLVHDGIFPDEFDFYAGPNTVSWVGQDSLTNGIPNSAVFTLTFDQIYTLQDVRLSIDNNDFYQMQVSIDGANWNTLFTALSFEGEVDNGMDTMSSVAGDPEFVTSIDFVASQARYARIYAVTGDNHYAVGEIQFTGTPAVPEPSHYALLGAGLIGLGMRLRAGKHRK